jgi:hypothetical protein
MQIPPNVHLSMHENLFQSGLKRFIKKFGFLIISKISPLIDALHLYISA